MEIERAWAMPNKWTFTIKPIKELLNEEMTEGLWVDPFCGLHSKANIKNDLNPQIPCSSHKDALIFLEEISSESVEGVLFDPPYSITQAKECYDKYGHDKLKISVTNMKYWASVKDEMSRILKPKGKAICFGWSSMGLGIGRNFKMTRILLVPHGGSKNDTICTIEIKKEKKNGNK